MVSPMSTSKRLVLASLLSAAALAGGCNWVEGGRGYSSDTFTYISTEYSPKTVSLIDTRTGQTVWSYELPVGRQLVLEFIKGDPNAVADHLNPDTLRWDDWEPKTYFGTPRQQLKVPNATARRIDVALRPTPESAQAPRNFRTLREDPKADPTGIGELTGN